MDICVAERGDLAHLARLIWADTAGAERDTLGLASFASDLDAWWSDHETSHLAFVARVEGDIVGMAWLALLPRIPRPGATARLSGDIQTVFVDPDHRGKGIGSALVQAASEHALGLGAIRVTVHSGRRAVPVYERLGFASTPQLLALAPESGGSRS